MKSFKITSLLSAFLMCAGAVVAQTSNPFEGEIRAFETADRNNPPPPNSIVFIGSSTIKGWSTLGSDFPDYSVLNRGFGGSQASDALYFFDRLVPPYRPPLVVFYEGDNDLASGKTVDQVFADWTNFVGRVQAELPNTHVMFISVKPSPSRAQLLNVQRALNEKVEEHAATDEKLHYVDVFTPMLNDSGQPRPELFVGDQLHMNPAGYALWKSIVGPAVDAWAADYPISVTRSVRNSALIDFGSPNSLSASAGAGAGIHWNNVTSAVAANNSGMLTDIVSTTGAPSTLELQMISRFNGVNENGTTASGLFPASATRDSLFGNTETFNGLANVTPKFRLAGLAPGETYKLTFYASRLGVGDNRETRYTVTGADVAFVDLNAGNNVSTTVSVEGAADSNGYLTVALAPGPNNNNANHFTYLAVMRLDKVSPAGPGFLFDFGGSGITSTEEATSLAWNDLSVEIGATDDGALAGLVATNGLDTHIEIAMLSRFNAANENGTTESSILPASATADSLYGNTEAFGGLANITPAFKLRNLDSSLVYDLTFFASRTGVSDNRETRFRVQGLSETVADLNAANNVDQVVSLNGVSPDTAGEIVVRLEPGPNNNNGNHFVYLGALQVSWREAGGALIALRAPNVVESSFSAELHGIPGMTYEIQASTDLQNWERVQWAPLSENSARIELPLSGHHRFFRLLQ